MDSHTGRVVKAPMKAGRVMKVPMKAGRVVMGAFEGKHGVFPMDFLIFEIILLLVVVFGMHSNQFLTYQILQNTMQCCCIVVATNLLLEMFYLIHTNCTSLEMIF